MQWPRLAGRILGGLTGASGCGAVIRIEKWLFAQQLDMRTGGGGACRPPSSRRWVTQTPITATSSTATSRVSSHSGIPMSGSLADASSFRHLRRGTESNSRARAFALDRSTNTNCAAGLPWERLPEMNALTRMCLERRYHLTGRRACCGSPSRSVLACLTPPKMLRRSKPRCLSSFMDGCPGPCTHPAFGGPSATMLKLQASSRCLVAVKTPERPSKLGTHESLYVYDET